jgi:hypothetical protein
VLEVWACDAVQVVTFEAAPLVGAFGGIMMVIRSQIYLIKGVCILDHLCEATLAVEIKGSSQLSEEPYG